MMQYDDAGARMADYRKEMAGLRAKMRALQQETEPQPVTDYAFITQAGPVRLSELFGDKDYLFVIHNMGASCVMCTMWADGFNGLLPHLENRAAFVLSSPDEPAAQAKFAGSRGWRMRMVSHRGTDFAAEMGYKSERGFKPGVSVFHKRNGAVARVSDTFFGPGDDFCATWHFLDLMPGGAEGWRPRFSYA